MKKRLLNVGMSIALCLSMLPTTAFAAPTPVEPESTARKGIMLRTDNLRGPVAHEGTSKDPNKDITYSGTYYVPSDYVYFGKYEQNGDTSNGAEPVKWRALGSKYLMSEYILAEIEFAEPARRFDVWNNNLAQFWCKDFAGDTNTGMTPSAFTEAEKYSIEVSNGFSSGNVFEHNGLLYSHDSLVNDRVFLPSLQEIHNGIANYYCAPTLLAYYPNQTEPSSWWTRTNWTVPDGKPLVSQVRYVNGKGKILHGAKPCGARPALRLDLGMKNKLDTTRVLMTTAAVDGKMHLGTGLKSLEDMSDYSGNEWKLTVVDDTRNDFTVSVNENKTIDYSHARTGSGEYLSAILVENGTNKLTHYGHLKKLDTPNMSSGRVTIDTKNLPSLKTHTLYVFNEQCNGNYETDYSSPIREVKLGAEEDYRYTYTATNGQIAISGGQDAQNCEILQGDWTTSITSEEGIRLFVNPESGPDGTMLTDVKSVTATGQPITWANTVYLTNDGRKLMTFFTFGMPNEDATITPIFDHVIERVNAGMLKQPLAGQTPNDIILTTGDSANYTLEIDWSKPGAATLKPDEVFMSGQDYIAHITIKSKEGYAFRGFRGSSWIDPIPEKQKTKVFYEGQAAKEDSADAVNPAQAVFEYTGDAHTMYLYVMFSNLPTAYEVHFDANGMEGSVPETLSYEGSETSKSLTVPEGPNPTKENYEFIGWNTKPDGSGTNYKPGDSIILTQNNSIVTLYAQSVAHTHKAVLINGQTATCEADGWKDYYKCDCGKFFEDEACTKEITNLDTWKSGEGKLDKLPHTYGEWIVVTPATETSEGLEKRICSVCKHEETRVIDKLEPTHKATVEGLSLSLADKIGVNYYLNISKDILADEAAYVEFTREDNTTVKFLMSEVKEKAKVVNGKTLYCLSVPMAARQMTDAINGKVVLSNGDTIALTQTSVQNYAKVILDNKDSAYSTEAINAVKAMLNYGAAAQVQFDNKVETLANAILSKEDQVVNVDNSVFDQYQASKEGSVAGIEYFGTSVLLRSETGFAHYFTLEENANIEDYTFTVNGQPVEVASREGKYYVEVNNIYAKDLANSYVVEVSKGEEKMTIAFGVFGYANVVVNGEYSEELQSVVRSMYPYYESALAYSESVTKK